MSLFTLPGLPYPVELLGEGGGTAVEPVRIAAGPRTDLFVDPQTGATTLNAARVVGDPGAGDFQLSVRVEVAFADTFDAGALLVWGEDDTWAKLLLEWSPEHRPTVVSVVTRGRSDDANAVTIEAALRRGCGSPGWAARTRSTRRWMDAGGTSSGTSSSGRSTGTCWGSRSSRPWGTAATRCSRS